MKQASFRNFSVVIAAAFLVALPGSAQTTAFTFQGRLNEGTAPADGSYDLKFTLYDAAGAGGTTIGGPVTNAASVVSAGLFTVTLDFGAGGFTGEDRWLEIAVRTNGGGAFLTLSPRQRLTSTPYAITAAQVTGVVPGSSLAGSYTNAVNFSNSANVFSGSFWGNGAALSNVNAATLGGLLPSGFWQLNGNNVAPGQFLGPTNEQALELRVNGYRALRLEPNPNNAPNVIGGSPLNQVDTGVLGATVGGGGGYALPNRISANFGTIGGGINNMISSHGSGAVIAGGNSNTNDSPGSFIGGGGYNRIEVSTNNYPAVIAGGTGNRIQVDNENSAIIAGINNLLGNAAAWSFLGGGGYNHVEAGALAASIVGGALNTNGSAYSLVGGGSRNYLQPQSDYSLIAGGLNNTIESTASLSSIGGGWLNYIQGGADQSVIAGGNAGHILSGARESFVGGGFANTIQTNAFNAVVVGGAANTNSSAEAFIGGGFGNQVGTNSPYAAIGAGSANSILTHAEGAVIGGGNGNVVAAPFGTVGGGQQNTSSWTYATIGGGYQNLASGNFSGSGDSATVAGGWRNAAVGNNAVVGGGAENYASGDNAAIAGGVLNTNQTGYGFIGGGNQNLIEPFSRFSLIGGGDHHTIHSNSLYAVIAGGQANVIGTNATFGMVLGGFANEVRATNALAAGRRAKALHQGSFVWADSTDADFFSTANDQFNIRAAGACGSKQRPEAPRSMANPSSAAPSPPANSRTIRSRLKRSLRARW